MNEFVIDEKRFICPTCGNVSATVINGVLTCMTINCEMETIHHEEDEKEV